MKTQISVSKNLNGSLVVSALHGGFLTSKVYYGYPKAKAVSMFRKELKQEAKR